MSNENEWYLVVELGTGLMDGWYKGERNVEGMRDCWDRKRPHHKHVVVKLVEPDRNGSTYFPDHMCMNRQPDTKQRELK